MSLQSKVEPLKWEAKVETVDVTYDKAIEDFADGVSILGVKYIFKKESSYVRRIAWLSFVLFGIGFLAYHLYNRIDYFLQRPSYLKREIERLDEIEYPAITICNNNPFRLSSLKKNNETFLLHKYGANGYNLSESELHLSTNNTIELYKKHGHQIQDMLVQNGCTFQGVPCQSITYKELITSVGLCYQVRGIDSNPLKTNLEGAWYAFNLELLVQQDEYLPDALHTGYSGLLISLDNPKDYVQPYNRGFYIPPGFKTKIGLKLHETTNMVPPHGSCGHKKLKYFRHYSLRNCLSECYAIFIRERCGCMYPHYAYDDPKIIPVCSPTQFDQCIVYFFVEKDSVTPEACGCPETCTFYTYEQEISSIPLSVTNIQGRIKEDRSKGVNFTSEEYYRKNLLQLSIYYESLKISRTIQEEAYSGLTLAADIGGALGLILGSTLMTVVEILDFMIMFFTQKKKAT